MTRIRSKNTKPEMLLRANLFKKGLRYRLHKRELPGKPDIVFVSKRLAVFIHGCFWHQHVACVDGRVPKSNVDYWESKLRRNIERDVTHMRDLARMGWNTMVVWECEILRDVEESTERVIRELS